MCRDAEVRYGQSGKPWVKVTVAVNREAKDGEESSADFIPVIAFGPQAEQIGVARKGDPVCAVGHIRSGSYLKDGVKVYTLEMVAHTVVVGAKRSVPTPETAAKPGKDRESSGDTNYDEIPF